MQATQQRAKSISPSKKNSDVLCRLKVKPHEQLHILLGIFEKARKLNGFVVELTPNPNPNGSVESHISRFDKEAYSTFFLDIANTGTKPILAEVHQL